MEAVTVQLDRTLRFLVVDDSRAIQAIVRRVIEGCGYAPLDIRTALDGEQALDLLDEFDPDLIITDWHMPNVSGIEMLQTLRQTGRSRMRVGFVTTESKDGSLEEARTNGALFVLNKPFKDEELIHAVRSAVQEITVGLKGGAAGTTAASAPPGRPGQQADAKSAAASAPATSGGAHTPAIETGADSPPPEGGPMPLPVLQAELKARLGAIPFKLTEAEPLTVPQLSPQNLLGLYSVAGTKGIYAVALLEMNAVCMLGGGMARQNPTIVRAAMGAGQASPAMLENTTALLKSWAALIGQSSRSDGKAVSLTTSSMVKSGFAKLAEVMGKNLGRRDFKLTIPGYGDGRLSFLLVSP